MPKIKYVNDNEWGTVFPNFKKEEFRCPKYCDGFPSKIAYSLLEVMQNLRNKYGTIRINSAVRCVQYNSELNGSVSDSDHLEGCACDWSLENHVFSEAEKNEIMTYIRTLPNIKYTYSNQTNMFNGIHISVNPTYELANITKFEIVEVGIDYVKIDFETDEVVDFAMYSLNGEDYINLDSATNIINNLKENTEYTLSIKLRTQGTDEWTVSDIVKFKTLTFVEEVPSEEIDNDTIVKENFIIKFFKKVWSFIKKIFKIK